MTPFTPPHPPREPRSPRASLIAVAALALVALIVVAVRHANPAAGFACEDHPAPRDPVAMTAYVEANLPIRDANAVLVIRYAQGDLHPLPIDCFRTGGRGSQDLADTGVLDADQQVVVNADHTRLFAVNQGSDTIAVFDIESDGDLRAVPGSPFPSGGRAPVSLGISGNTLLVVNKAHDGVRNLTSFSPNITSFRIGTDGTLTPISGSTFILPHGSNPAQALISPDGHLMFGTNPAGPLRAFVINPDGTFTQGPNSPLQIDPAAFTPGFPEGKRFALGLGVHPTQPLLYASLPPASGLAVYRYGTDGTLTFVSEVPNQGAWLPCWTITSADGRTLYTANAGSDDISVFDIGSDPQSPRQIQSFAFDQPGNPWNISLDPSGHYLLGLTPRDLPGVPEGEGNTLHLLEVAGNGTVREVSQALVKLPVPVGTNPQGLAVT